MTIQIKLIEQFLVFSSLCFFELMILSSIVITVESLPSLALITQLYLYFKKKCFFVPCKIHGCLGNILYTDFINYTIDFLK